MRLENYLTPISEQGHRVLDLMKVDHKHASELLDKKFQEAVKKAKETPDTGRPIRDFDLD